MSLSTPPLTQLRLGFIALTLALMVAVLGLLQSALSRLDEQQRLRHRMVAERVFDEAEREISSLLQHEVERPSEAYDAIETDPSRWARFIVGYYRRSPELHIVAEAQLSAQRVAAVTSAVERARAKLDADDVTTEATRDDDDVSGTPSQLAPRSPDVLRQLNRSVKVRERRQQVLERSLHVVVADTDTLVVERVASDRREGFVLHVPDLVATIQSWVLSAQGLDQVATLTTERARVDAIDDGYDFSHQLAAPLDSQRVSLRLSQLDDEDGKNTLYGLAALLICAAAFGLFALYRMVAVQIGFAERRNNFVAAVTHELRTPLTSIRMYGEMLRDGMVADEATRHEYYATITAEGERLTRLINNVMEHGQLRRGQRRVHLTRGDVAVVVRDVMDVMEPHIEREGFVVTLTLAGALPHVEHDSDALKQVLFNVIDNALKYGRVEGQSRIEVSCEPATVGGGVVLRVRDWGPGVGDGVSDAVFEPFFRGESELTRRHKGTGLGLALVRDLVTLMNGNVRATNRHPGFEISIVLRAATTS